MPACSLCTKPYKIALGKARFCYHHGQEFLVELLKTLEHEYNISTDPKRKFDLERIYIAQVKSTLAEMQQHMESEE